MDDTLALKCTLALMAQEFSIHIIFLEIYMHRWCNRAVRRRLILQLISAEQRPRTRDSTAMCTWRLLAITMQYFI